MEEDLVDSLVGFHSFTSNDYVSSLFRTISHNAIYVNKMFYELYILNMV